MIFTCPTCDMQCNVRKLPMRCCGVRHDESSESVVTGGLAISRPPKTQAAVAAPCIHRGRKSGQDECVPCGGVRCNVFSCDIYNTCTLSNKLPLVKCCANCNDRVAPDNLPQWITTAQLSQDSAKLATLLPGDLDAVAGVTRSGMVPATIVAMQRHLPLYEINPDIGLKKIGNGWRLGEQNQSPQKFAIIDDTTATGKAMRMLRARVLRSVDSEFVLAAVYASYESSHGVDYFTRHASLPHYLEWNFFNSIHSKNTAFDFDGVICEECPHDCDDDGPKYLEWLTNAKPLHLPRKYPARLIVTARLEKYRAATLAWLARHNVQVETLVMGQWESLGVRREDYDAGRYKGGQYKRSMCDLFVESCPIQSEAIAAASGKRVICPSVGRIWN